MSVLEELQQAHERVITRLAELEPLAAEYEQLRAEAERLGLGVDPTQAPEAKKPAVVQQASTKRRAAKRSKTRRKNTPPAAPESATLADGAAAPTESADAPKRGRSTKTKKPRAGQSRQRAGQRTEDVLRLVAQTPGLTMKELGSELGVDPTGLYAPVRKLVQNGQLKKTGTKLEPVAN